MRQLSKLKARLLRRGISYSSRYFMAVDHAHDALYTVLILTHYAACGDGVHGANQVDPPEDPEKWLGDGI